MGQQEKDAHQRAGVNRDRIPAMRHEFARQVINLQLRVQAQQLLDLGDGSGMLGIIANLQQRFLGGGIDARHDELLAAEPLGQFQQPDELRIMVRRLLGRRAGGAGRILEFVDALDAEAEDAPGRPTRAGQGKD